MRPRQVGSERLQNSEQSIVRLEAPEWRAPGKTFANAFCLMARFACKCAFVVSMLSRPRHNAMTAMSTPD
jgi:hypothetical protein